MFQQMVDYTEKGAHCLHLRQHGPPNFPSIQCDFQECIELYKIRTIVERTINHFKINMCVAGRKTRNHVTTKAYAYLDGIASQLTVIVAHRMNCHDYIRSLKPLVA